MKKLNNKGLTLIELLISIVLIGIVLTFLVRLLTDLRNEIDNNDYAYGNQVNKSDALYTIQMDLNKNEIISIIKINNSTIRFVFNDNTTESAGTLLLIGSNNKRYIQYIDSNGVKYKWEMKGVTTADCATIKKYFYEENGIYKYYFMYNLPLYTNSENNSELLNNVVDDFEITYSDYYDDSFLIFSDNNICYQTN